MNKIESLLSDYRDFAIKHGEASKNGDYRTANKSHTAIMKALKKLISLGEDFRLLELLSDEKPEVRCWAATHCLEINEPEALKTLENLKNGNYTLISFGAEYAIKEWEIGNLRVRKTISKAKK